MIGHREEVKGMGVVVRVFLLRKLFWLSHSWFNFVLGSTLFSSIPLCGRAGSEGSSWGR